MNDVLVRLKAYIICEINRPIIYHNDSTFNDSFFSKKAMRKVLDKIEELEKSTL